MQDMRKFPRYEMKSEIAYQMTGAADQQRMSSQEVEILSAYMGVVMQGG